MIFTSETVNECFIDYVSIRCEKYYGIDMVGLMFIDTATLGVVCGIFFAWANYYYDK